ncbi:MAG: hypothetical protein U1F43_33455 [Myxococcota bacterium]
MKLPVVHGLVLGFALAACGKGAPPKPAEPTAPAATTAPAPAPDAAAPAAADTAAPAAADDVAPAAADDAAPAAADDAAPVAADDAAPAGPTGNDLAATALLTSWVKAQVDGDFAAYMTFYDAGFKGVKRTATAGPKELDLAAWKTDREKMFKAKMEVAAEEPIIAPGDGGTTTVTFVQRWKSGKYADHGQKVLTLKADAGGALKIIGEDMKTSERGWDDSKDMARDLSGMTPPFVVSVAVERRPLPADAMMDCRPGMLEVTVEDSTKAKVVLAVGIVTGMASDDVKTLTQLAPDKEGKYQDLGVYCAGIQDGWIISKDGDALIATDVWNDEQTGEGKERHVLAKLPAGASVTLK